MRRNGSPSASRVAARLLGVVAVCYATAAAGLSQPPADTPTGEFDVRLEKGGIVGLKRVKDKFDTDYVQKGRRLGDVTVRYRQGDGAWKTVDTAALAGAGTGEFTTTPENKGVAAAYSADGLVVKTALDVKNQAVEWKVTVENPTDQPIEVGDLAVPLPMNSNFAAKQPATAAALKHSFVSGHGSFLFWMRSNSVGPYLTLTPAENTQLEYWDAGRGGGGGGGAAGGQMGPGYRVYIHSAAAGAESKRRGTNWRQPNTNLVLAPKGKPGDTKTYGMKFRWGNDYDHVRQILVDEGLIDVHVVPGMTVPSDLFAKFALRTKQPITAVEAEHADATKVESLGANGDAKLYQVKFSKLGENRLTVRFGNGRHMYLEFFCTEPVETLIKKRGAFLAAHQTRDTNKWYNGLLCEWNMDSKVQLSPDNYDKIMSWRIYEVTCDDPGLGKPAFLASKNAEFPVQAEVEALDYYIKHFVWGGLQQTTTEPYPFGVYGIPDWKKNRESMDEGRNGKRHLWRIYDYPHIVVMYHGMYKVAKNHPQIKTEMPAVEYLKRAAGTAIAMFTVPMAIERWSAYRTGLYNELVYADLIDDLKAAGLTIEADQLRGHWERKAKFFVNDRPNLFGSEYPFDSTGFESTHALAKYAIKHADAPGETKTGFPAENAKKFLDAQMAANVFCRGWLEPTYYYLGSDYRGSAGNSYTLSYMSQMGGWAVLDYAMHYAADPAPYTRLGYASMLSSWALMNTGTPESNYGYWYPGKENDGGAGGGFEPAPYGQTWLQQPHHRGSWYYSCEEDLGFCGGLRGAATVLADDPIFGRFCYGGDLQTAGAEVRVVPKDGLRRRFDAVLKSGKLHLNSDVDKFPAGEPIRLKDDLSEVTFRLESANPNKHAATVRVSGLTPGRYAVRSGDTAVAELELKNGQESIAELPMDGGTPKAFTLVRQSAGK